MKSPIKKHDRDKRTEAIQDRKREAAAADEVEYETVTQTMAQLYYTSDELGVLLDCVEKRLAGSWGAMPTTNPQWPMLNSLRTSLAEAKWALDRYENDDGCPNDDEVG